MSKNENPQTAGPPGKNNFQASNGKHDLDLYYPFIIQAIQAGIWIIDREGQTIYVNNIMADLLGMSLHAIHDKKLTDFLSEQDGQMILAKISRSTHNDRQPFECRYHLDNDSVRWAQVTSAPVKDNEGNIVGLVTIHTDITERKKAEDPLRNYPNAIGVVLDSVRDFAIMIVDIHRTILIWNKGAREIFGYTENEAIGQKADMLFTEEDRDKLVPQIELDTALKSGHSYDDRWHARKDGSRFYASGVMTRLDQAGEATRFVKIARDWTDRKKIEETLKNADRHKNEFLATLAHELRNPLASILSGVEVLSQEKNDMALTSTREIIARQVQQMIHLVNDLLDISRISLGKIKINKQPVNLLDAVHLALETSRSIIEGYKHALTVSLPAGPVIVDGDLTRLSQVFLNLLINSAKYTAQGGEIIFTVKRENNEAVVKLRDNGMGIPSNMLSSIFEMFEQIQDRSEYPQAGLGIGLSVVKQLVEMHDGQVAAFSEGSNKGSEFVVRLPMNQTASDLSSKYVKNVDKNQKRTVKKRILLVDDNVDAADMLELLLTKRGYLIEKANDGKTAIDKAVAFDPDIVILDLGLPDINGYEVLAALQNKLGKRHYIALSGWGQDEDLRRSKQAGFEHHLVKPIEIQFLDDILSPFQNT